MDSPRSVEAEGSYSEEFDRDLDSPDSRFSDKVPVKIYKSAVGGLTVMPKKLSKPKQSPRDDTFDDYELNANIPSPPSSRDPDLEADRKPPASAVEPMISPREASCPKLLSVQTVTQSKGSNTGKRSQIPRKPPLCLSKEKVEPRDIPPTVGGSASSASVSRQSIRNGVTTPGAPRGTTNTIRRVVAHTSIKEKSYGSAKFKTYQSPGMHRVGPPLKTGIAKQTNASQRVASAKRMTVMDLKSKIKLLQDEIENLKKENRFLNRMHHRQDSELRKWEGKDADLPRLLNQHKDEIRSLSEQLRRAQQNVRDHNEKIAARDKKIFRLEAELDKLKALVHEEHLQDRHTLKEDLEVTRMNLSGAEKRIREYMRHVEILEKNHKHQMAAQERKFVKVNSNTYELQQQVANLRLALRNKDRMLNYIQMRASGRTLIRAFHAEKDEKTELNEMNASFQSQSMSKFPEMSPCGTPRLDVHRDYEIFTKNQNQKPQNDGCLESTKVPIRQESAVSKHSEAAESVISQESPRPEMKKSVQKSKSLVTASDKKSIPKSFMSELKLKERHEESSKKKPAALSGREAKNSDDFLQLRYVGKFAEGDSTNLTLPAKMKEESAIGAQGAPRVEEVISKEFVYMGASNGVKYDGPFVSLAAVETAKKRVTEVKESTEILYTPKSEKALTERSLSSNCSTPSVLSSRSEEIISNIDILSARIRESCVLVAPVEEKFKSPRDKRTANNIEALSERSKKSTSTKSQAPSKKKSQTNDMLSSSTTSFGDTSKQSLLIDDNPGILRQVHRITKKAPQKESQSSATTTSPGIMPKSSLHSPSFQSQQFQMNPCSESTYSLSQMNDTPTVTVVTNASPIMDNSGLAYYSPRLHGYDMTLSGVPVPLGVESTPSPLVSSRLPNDFSYYGVTTQAPNVTVYQGFSPMHSPHTTKPSQGSIYTGPTRTYNPMGAVNSGLSNTDQSLPSIGSNNSPFNLNTYNPSYYTNLGSWK